MVGWLLCGMCFLSAILPSTVSGDVREGEFYVCDETGNPIEGAVFVLYKEEKMLVELLSNQKGEMIVEDLSEGDYSMYQKSSSYGYLRLEEAFTFSINEQTKKNSWEILNPRMLGSVTLTIKIDDPLIQEAQIVNENQNVVKSVSLNDEAVIVDQLPVGTYYVKFEGEEDFDLNENVLFFDITPYNYDTDYKLTLHQTVNTHKEDYTFAVSFIAIVLIGGILLILVVWKKDLLKDLRED